MTIQFAAVILNGLTCNIINMYWEKKKKKCGSFGKKTGKLS